MNVRPKSKEFYELLDMFERIYGKCELEDDEYFKYGQFIRNGEVNKLFMAFLHGYTYAKSLYYEEESGD